MGSSEFVGYCSFTKAIEHLGDRWSLLIVRELGMFGPQGFNDLGCPAVSRARCSPIGCADWRLLGWCHAVTARTRTPPTASPRSVKV